MSLHCNGRRSSTVYPKKYAHGFVVLCFVVVMQSFIMTSHEVFIHIHQGCFAGTGAIVRLPQCQWSKPDGYGKISQCITTTKHSKAKTVCIFLGIYCRWLWACMRLSIQKSIDLSLPHSWLYVAWHICIEIIAWCVLMVTWLNKCVFIPNASKQMIKMNDLLSSKIISFGRQIVKTRYHD